MCMECSIHRPLNGFARYVKIYPSARVVMTAVEVCGYFQRQRQTTL
jgi:hypothetical protein